MAISNPNRLVNVQELSYFEGKLAVKYQGKAINLDGITAKTVEGALSELKSAIANGDIAFEKLSTPNTGKAATYRFTKGTGAGATTMDIDIEKDEVRAIVGFVTITEGTGADAGKYFDGSTEVGSEDGVTHAGVYLKSQELSDGTATGVVKYADASAVIEYITLGTQTGKAVTLTLTSDHELTADIAEKAIQKSHLAQGVQDSLDLADSALQAADITGKADKDADAVEGNFASFDANGNPVDSGHKHADYKTVQTAVASPSVPVSGETESLEFIDTISQNANGVISPTKKVVKAAAPYVDAQTPGNAGLMSAADKAKLDAIGYATNNDIDEIFS